MATAEDMAIRTTWLFSLEMEKAAERPRTADIVKIKCETHIVTYDRKLTI